MMASNESTDFNTLPRPGLTHAQFLEKGHGKIAPWADLVNSEEWDTFGRRTEHLTDPSWLAYFLKQWHFRKLQGDAIPLTEFRRLRTVLRNACEALRSGHSLSDGDLRVLNGYLNTAGKHRVIRGQNGRRHDEFEIEFAPIVAGWSWILALTALSFASLLANGESERVRICENDGCKWVFFDNTKARRRRWCSDKVCGNRDRVRRARAKTAAG
jgi:predicted RNA-binding Zn ribbon-like protein